VRSLSTKRLHDARSWQRLAARQIWTAYVNSFRRYQEIQKWGPDTMSQVTVEGGKVAYHWISGVGFSSRCLTIGLQRAFSVFNTFSYIHERDQPTINQPTSRHDLSQCAPIVSEGHKNRKNIYSEPYVYSKLFAIRIKHVIPLFYIIYHYFLQLFKFYLSLLLGYISRTVVCM